MDELPITGVDRCVADLTATASTEEQHIARLKLVARHQRCVDVDHFTRGTWQAHAGLFAKQITDEAAAIETRRSRRAAELVACADQRLATLQDAVGQGRQLVRLVISELGQFVFGSELVLQDCRVGATGCGLGVGIDCALIAWNWLGLFLLCDRHIGRATEEKCNECERHEGCEANNLHGHNRG